MKKLNISTIYSQRDGRWSANLLGFNTDPQYSIGNYGCLLTCLAMYCTATSRTETPPSLNEKIKNVNGFVSGGLYDWTSLTRVYSDVAQDFTSAYFSDAVPDSALDKMRSLIDAGKPLLVEIDFNPATVVEDMHFVLVYGYDDNNVFYIVDPWTGTKTTLDVYGDVKRVVYSFRCYSSTVQAEKPQLLVDSDIYEHLVNGATVRKDVASYLELSDPDNTQFVEIQRVIAGLKSRATDLQTQLTKAQTDATNNSEQVSRLKEQLLNDEKLRAGLTNSLNEAMQKLSGVQKVYEDQLAVKQGQVDTIAKEKGQLNVTIQTLTSTVEQQKTRITELVANQTKTYTVGELVMMIWKKIMPIKIKV